MQCGNICLYAESCWVRMSKSACKLADVGNWLVFGCMTNQCSCSLRISWSKETKRATRLADAICIEHFFFIDS